MSTREDKHGFVYGWEMIDATEDGAEVGTLIIKQNDDRYLKMEHELGMDVDTLREFAGTRVLEAKTEDIARTVVPNVDHRLILAALYSEDAELPDVVKKARKRLLDDHLLAAALAERNDHLAISRERQQIRGRRRAEGVDLAEAERRFAEGAQ